MSRPPKPGASDWAVKVLALVRAGNTQAAVSQIKASASLKDVQQLQKALAVASLASSQPGVATAVNDQLSELSHPRLHRSP